MGPYMFMIMYVCVCACFSMHSPVDVYFASASYDRTARLWATDLVYPLRIFAGHTAAVDVCTCTTVKYSMLEE